MGTASSNKNTFLCRKLNNIPNHTSFGIKFMDELIHKGIHLIYEIEIIRCNFVPKWNKFISLTGAIVIDSPHFDSGINGLLIAMAISLLKDNQKIINNVKIDSSYPFLHINPDLQFNRNVNDILEAFNDLCKYSKEHYEDIIILNNNFEELFKCGCERLKDPKEIFLKKGYSYNEIEILYKRYKEFLILFKNGKNCVNVIINRIKEMELTFEKYEELCNDEVIMNRFYKVACECKEKNIYGQKRIMFRFSNEKKIMDFDDVYEREELFEKNESNAKCFLSNIDKEKEYYKGICSSRSNKENINSNNIQVKSKSSEIPIIPNLKSFHLSNEKSVTSEDLKAAMKTYPPLPIIPIQNITNFHLQKTFSLNDPKIQNEYPTHIHYIHNIHKLIITLNSGIILIYDYPQFKLTQEITNIHTNSILSIIHTLPNNTLLTSSNDVLFIHNYNTSTSTFYSGQLLNDIQITINCMCDLYDGSYIAVGVNNTIGCFDYDMDNLLFSYKAHDSQINDLLYLLDKDLIISCGDDCLVKIWKFNERECIGILNDSKQIVFGLNIIKINDEVNVISVGREGMVVCWNLNTKEKEKEFKFGREIVKVVDVGGGKMVGVLKKGCCVVMDIEKGEYKEYKGGNGDVELIGGFYDNEGENVGMISNIMDLQLWSTS